MTPLSPHVNAATCLRWALTLHRLGIHQAAGLTIAVEAHAAFPGSGGVTVTVYLAADPHVVLVLRGYQAEDGPAHVEVFSPGIWTADLYRAAIVAADNEEE